MPSRGGNRLTLSQVLVSITDSNAVPGGGVPGQSGAGRDCCCRRVPAYRSLALPRTVLPTLPKYGQATLGVEFLLLRRQFHTRLATRASAGGSTGVVTVRGTPGQLLEIDRGIQIPVQQQPTRLTVKRPIRQRQIRIDPA